MKKLTRIFLALFLCASPLLHAASPFDGQDYKEVFPRYIKIERDDKTIYLSRNGNILDMFEDTPGFKKDDLRTFPELPTGKINFNTYFKDYEKMHNIMPGIEHHAVTFVDGKAYVNDELYTTSERDLYRDGSLFAMDENGRLFIRNENTCHHHTLLGGAYIICGGEVMFDQDSKIITMNNRTGHYSSTPFQFQTAVKILDAQNAFAEDAMIHEFANIMPLYTVDEFLKLDLPESEQPTAAKTVEELHAQFEISTDLPSTIERGTTAYTKVTQSNFAKKVAVLLHYKRVGMAGMPLSCIIDETDPIQGMTITEYRAKVDELTANRPHPEIYDEVINARMESFMSSQSTMMGGAEGADQ